MDPSSSSSNVTGVGADSSAAASAWSPMGGSASDGIPAGAAGAAAAAAAAGGLVVVGGGGSLFGQSPPILQQQQPQQQQQPGYGYGYGYQQQQPQQQQQQQPVYGLASPQQQQQQQQYPQQQQQYQQTAPTTPNSNNNVNVGSITRFATPGATPTAMTPQDIAAAAAMASPPQQQQQQQQQQFGSSSYASRSTQAYSVQQQPPPPPQQLFQQPQFQQQQQQPSAMPAAATSYAARSALAQQQLQNQQPPPQSFAARSAQAYATNTTTPQQQQFQQPGMMQQSTAGGGGGGGGGGYAERAAQAYAQQQPPSQLQQQPQSGGGGSGGYAARSAQAYSMSQQQYSTSMAATPVAPGVVNPYVTTAVPPAATMQQPQLHQQQQQQQFSPPPQATAPPAAAVAGGGGGYAARAAQAYATQQPQQQPQQQQYQQPQSMVGAGGYNNPAAAAPPQPMVLGMMPPQQQPQLQQQQQQQPGGGMMITAQEQANQQRMLTDATRKIQEHAYYMKQAMDQHNLPVILDRASYMVGELGGLLHGQQQSSSASGAAASGNSTSSSSMGLSNTGVSSKLTPKNYYELFMRALEDLPALEDYLLNLSQQQQQHQPNDINNPLASQPQIHIIDTSSQGAAAAASALAPTVGRTSFCMRELYDCVQYCPRVVSRLYLQISAGSALVRSGEAGSKWVLQDLICATRCEQNPIRGLFLRNFLLTALRDHLPDVPVPSATVPVPTTATVADADGDSSSSSLVDAGVAADNHNNDNNTDNINNDKDDIMAKGNVMDSVEFVMENFMEMNKLWVRIQHLPGEGRNKDVRKRRERERNDLRILVGTNLVRLSQLECVTSKIYGESILPRILDHVVVVGDPLSQAYLMDCLVQVFPDEYHIETLPILLNVCPRLRDKVNIRTILQGLMDRLANYLAEEELLDESDTNQVKKELARDSFGMFEECVQKVYNARGPKLTSKEVIRLQTALLQFSLKVYPGNMQQVQSCMLACILALQQANASYSIENSTSSVIQTLDEASVTELEKLLSIPLDSLALRVLEIEHYSQLITFLPFINRRGVAVQMLQAVDQAGAPPSSVQEIHQLFQIILPLIHDEQSIQHASSTTASLSSSSAQQVTSLMAGLGINEKNQAITTPTIITTSFGNEEIVTPALNKECALVSKLVHLLDNNDTDVVYEMLLVARNQICQGGRTRAQRTLVAVSFAALKLARRILAEAIASTTAAATTRTAVAPAASSSETFVVDNGNTASAAPSTQAAQKEEEMTKEPAASNEEKPSEEPAATDEDKTGNGETLEAAAVEDAVAAAETSVIEAETTCTTADTLATETTTAVAAGDGTETPAVETEIVAEAPAADTETATDTPPAATPDAARTEPAKEPAPPKATSPRRVFVFLEETISALGKVNPETAVKLFLEAALTADSLAANDQLTDFGPISYELLSQAFSFYEENNMDSNGQHRCVQSIMGTLMACKALSTDDYATLITKTAQFSAKLVKKPSQCQMVALAAHLFYPVNQGETMKYSNAQRALECLQRALKLADACVSSNPDHVQLFVDLLEHYLFFFEKNNPLITHGYITGLVALIKEHLNNLSLTSSTAVREAQTHLQSIVKEIKRKKSIEGTAILFAGVQVDNV